MTYARAILSSAFALTLLTVGACGDRGLSSQANGYLASDVCVRLQSEQGCALTSGCGWIETAVATDARGCDDGRSVEEARCDVPAKPATGVCVSKDPCLSLDAAGCGQNDSCAWSQTKSLCPVGAKCGDGGGFCHAKDNGGGSCACVSPLACPDDAPCAPVECDCTGGMGGGGGGACSCACPACAPGEDCPPCACDCDGGNPGCTDPGTCVCNCAASTGSDGPAPACDCACTNGSSTTMSPRVADPCGQYKDAESCVQSGTCAVAPGPSGAFVCSTINATDNGTSPTPPPDCACACPNCPTDTNCGPCECDCGSGGGGGGGMEGCVPPPVPEPAPAPAPGPTR